MRYFLEDEASVLRSRLTELAGLLTESQLNSFLTKHNVSTLTDSWSTH